MAHWKYTVSQVLHAMYSYLPSFISASFLSLPLGFLFELSTYVIMCAIEFCESNEIFLKVR